MAQISVPRRPAAPAILDRPLAPSLQRLTALLAHREVAAYGCLLLIGFALRLWDVGGRAMHHDESLHAYYAWKFFVGQGYSYNPLMHGPLQFEVAPLFYLLFGDSELTSRLLAVVLGSVCVVLPYFLREYLTPAGSLLASVMFALSPSLVYYSRFIRDDIYLVCFSLVIFICLVKYLDDHRRSRLYVAAAAAALALASMEAAYITFFIFGSFLAFAGLREYLSDRTGPILGALRATSLDVWLTAASIFLVITVLLYSTFFTNPDGIWDTHHSLTSPLRRDILGGLTYWKTQHGVQRGGQPWFYYLLILPLYEQLAVLFGLAGLLYALVRRNLVHTFLVWWAVMSLALYSWAGEKMPWLSIHTTVPLLLLAGLVLGRVAQSKRTWIVAGASGTFLLLLAVQTHATFVLNYVNSADPTELLIYVQSAPEVPRVANELVSLDARTHAGGNLTIGLDDTDVGGWPFTWYLRNEHAVTETQTFTSSTCGSRPCAALVMLGPQFDKYGGALLKTYVAQKYRWNWWNNEDYKTWFPSHWAALGDALAGKSVVDETFLPTTGEMRNLWNWLLYRQPFSTSGERWLYFLVRRDLVPGARYFPTHLTGGGSIPVVASGPTLRTRLLAHFGLTGAARLVGPRAVAALPTGGMLVADGLAHRIIEYGPSGSVRRIIGATGTGPGQFNARDSPQGVAVARNGNIVAADTWNHRIEVFDRRGNFLRSWGSGTVGTAHGQFYGPRSVGVSSDGRVYVADTGNKRIQVFSLSGQFLLTWGTMGTAPSQFQEPSAVAVGPRGQVYVADFWNQRIQVFDRDGVYQASWAVSDWPAQNYQEPYLTVDPTSGNVFSTEPSVGRVIAYTSAGRLLGSFAPTSGGVPTGIAALTGRRIAVDDTLTNDLTVYRVASGMTALPRRDTGREVPTRQTPKGP